MLYTDFQGLKLSALGFGAMRLPVVDGDHAKINEPAATEMVDYALQHGINYYDTAWGYHDGASETFMGKVLGQYPRQSFFLASKFPGYDLSNMDKAAEIFEAQLQKCGVDYFDFYLLHNICEMNIDAYLDKRYQIPEYFLEQKKKGRIRHLGFSAHAGYDSLQRFLAVWGEQMEFGQLQLNYLDWSFQQGKAKAELLQQYHIPLWAMEPLRGGKLATLPDAAAKTLKALRPDEEIPAWAFRFLQTIPGVGVTLSGMSNLRQLQDNIRTFETCKPLNDEEKAALLRIADDMLSRVTLPCTACRYCTTHCPQKLDIPALLDLYNEYIFTGGGFLAPMLLSTMPEDKRPGACIGCKSCEAVCPQQIHIAKALSDFAAGVSA